MSARENRIAKALGSDGVDVWLDNDGALIQRGGSKPTVANTSLTQSSNEVTADGSVTVADGSAPSNDEIYELAVELLATQDEILTALENAGILSTS